MTNWVARYQCFPKSDNAIALRKPGANIHLFENFVLPGLPVSGQAPAVLFFRVNPKQVTAVTLQVDHRLHFQTVTNLLKVTFKSDIHRSWHEIISPDVMGPYENDLIVSVTTNGSIEVSDFVILYIAESIAVKASEQTGGFA